METGRFLLVYNLSLFLNSALTDAVFADSGNEILTSWLLVILVKFS